MPQKTQKKNAFTLIEIMIAIFIIVIASLGILGMFQFSAKVLADGKARVGAIAVANEVSELIRNVPYDDIGTIGGVVAGVIPQTDTVVLNNTSYTVTTSIVYVDDEFDGTVALGTDQYGNDYKKIRVAVSWSGNLGTKEIVSVSTVAPKGIESDQGGGVLRISVIDAEGVPVPDADIHIVNNAISPAIDDSSIKTNSEGIYLSSVPTSTSAYEITVTKNGYSSDFTCGIDPVGTSCSSGSDSVPSPTKPSATVLESQLTQISFAIDVVSTLNISTVSQTIPNEWTVNTDGGSADQYSPALALGTNGNYYFVWQDFRDFASRIYAQNDQGVNPQWTPDENITNSNNQSSADVATDGNNDIYYVWHDDKNGNKDIYIDKYNDSGTELWGGSNKINTDSTAADQQSPKIIYNASSTDQAMYVAWKDDRAGSGQSDIYLQRFDTDGNAQWSGELKANFSSSGQYQAIDTQTWDFTNSLSYTCDGGNCDGTSDVEVTTAAEPTGEAKLVSIKTCSGTAVSCDSLVDSSSCSEQSGCSWDAVGPCEDGSCDCSLVDNETDCAATGSCNWTGGAPSCGGNCSCASISGKSNCQNVPGCSWFWFFCYDNPGCGCGSIGGESLCENAACTWGTGSGSCGGSCGCSSLTNEPICSQANCSWDSEGPCSGTANDCTSLSSQISCESQSGCIWSGSGSSYPSDNPTVSPVDSFNVLNLISWDSFTETATKNGGEIYYQLSDDNGLSWKYWSGSTWSNAGTNNYNTASTINTNINAFPADRESITFKAFLDSNGTNQVILENIDIGYSYTTSGGGTSQAVDLDVDSKNEVYADENIYVVWEDYQIDNYDIFIQKITNTGSIDWVNDIRVNTIGTGDQNNPAVKVDYNNDIVVVWQDNRNGDTDIYAQKYDSNGTLIWSSGDTLVSSVSGTAQDNPKIVIDNSNNIYVTWQDSRNGDNDIYLQKLNSDGVIQWANDVRVNSVATDDQINPDIIINSSGNLVITWQDSSNGNYDIRAAEYGGDPSATTNIPNVPLVITGSKLVSSSPDIYKYSQNLSTNGSGNLIIDTLEWDTYEINLQGGSGFNIVSTEPPLPVSLDPGETQNIILNID